MPPHNKFEGIVKIANPFELPIYKKGGPSLEEHSAVYYSGSNIQHEVADDDDDEPVVQITTRARYTYELDRFEKNAMLVINNSDADAEMTLYFLHAFQNHRFQLMAIETEHSGTDEIWHKIDQFFQQDFSTFGAVAVATLSCPDENTTERENCVQEWDVLNYFLSNQPSTLREKPKIFISEALEPSSLPAVTSLPSDILLIQTQSVTREKGFRPLNLLCYKFISMEGQRDFLEILSESTYEASQAFPTPSPINFLNMLTKELMFQKDIAQEDEVDDWMAKMADPVLFQICWRMFMQTKSAAGENIELTAEEIRNSVVEYNDKKKAAHSCKHHMY